MVPSTSGSTAPQQLSGLPLRILYLEDDHNDVLLAEKAARSSGVAINVVHVASQSEFERALASERFDLILSDNGLPGLSGKAALEQSRVSCPGVPFIFLSRALEQREVRRAGEGEVDVIAKSELWRLPGIIRRIADRRSQQDAFLRLERRSKAQDRLVSAVQELSLARNLDSVMSIVRKAARELTGADGATFILRDSDKCFYADEDAIAPLWKRQRFPLDACISGWAMLNRCPAVIEDIYADSRIPHDAYRPTFVKSLVMVPIRPEAPIGAIGNYWAAHHLATDDEVNLLQALANTTAVAMENVQIYCELEQRVRDRTLQLEQANQELESFSYSVSHDLRAPLQHISGFAGMVLEESGPALNDTSRQYLQRIDSATHHMAALIDDLLRFAHFAQLELQSENVDVSAMAREIAGQLQSSDPSRQAQFTIEDGMVARGDPGLLRVVLENLLSNAWKYTSTKDVSRVHFGSVQAGRSREFFVRDNGVGFNMRYADRLFAPFCRLHGQEEFPGNGIGLATVRRIIHRHGGTIWAEAQPGEGATFHFTLPH